MTVQDKNKCGISIIRIRIRSSAIFIIYIILEPVVGRLNCIFALPRASTPVGEGRLPTSARTAKRSMADDEVSTSSRDEEVGIDATIPYRTGTGTS